jgi:hypothetical protein
VAAVQEIRLLPEAVLTAVQVFMVKFPAKQAQQFMAMALPVLTLQRRAVVELQVAEAALTAVRHLPLGLQVVLVG